MRWKQIIITDKLYERLKEIQIRLGYKSVWRVIDEAVRELERKLKSDVDNFVADFNALVEKYRLERLSNAGAIARIVYYILNDEELTAMEKQDILGHGISKMQKMLHEIKKKKLEREMEMAKLGEEL